VTYERIDKHCSASSSEEHCLQQRGASGSCNSSLWGVLLSSLADAWMFVVDILWHPVKCM
jgi:hypothetical protein